MTLTVHLASTDGGACRFFRVTAPAEALAGQVEFRNLHSDPVLPPASSPSVVFVQRPSARWYSEYAIPQAQALGHAVVVDLDDLLSGLHPEHVAYTAYGTNADDNAGHLARAVALADVLTVTTPALAKFYAHPRTHVIPNMLPAAQIVPHVGSTDGMLRVGWPGLTEIHPRDLDVVRRPLRMTMVRPWRFVALGDPLTLDRVDQPAGEVWPFVPLADYPASLARLDAGVAPLHLSRFNECKSFLRPLSFAAAGVPFVATSTGPARALGAGLLARSSGEWTRQLRRLLTDAGLRDDLRERGYEIARANTLEAGAGRWLDAWSDAWDARHG